MEIEPLLDGFDAPLPDRFLGGEHESGLAVEVVRGVQAGDREQEDVLRAVVAAVVERGVQQGSAEPAAPAAGSRRNQLGPLGEVLGGPEAATRVLAVMRGLLLDFLATGDRQRVDAAWRRFADAMG